MGDEEMFPSTHAVGHTPFLMHLLCFVGYHHRAERAATRLAHVHRTSLWAPGGFLAPVQATPPRRSILSADAGRGGGREWDEPVQLEGTWLTIQGKASPIPRISPLLAVRVEPLFLRATSGLISGARPWLRWSHSRSCIFVAIPVLLVLRITACRLTVGRRQPAATRLSTVQLGRSRARGTTREPVESMCTTVVTTR